jgi:hypothetical protein
MSGVKPSKRAQTKPKSILQRPQGSQKKNMSPRVKGCGLAASRAEYDRLTEQSPAIDDAVIDAFKTRFAQYDVSKPAIANGLDKCTIFKHDPEAPPSPELSLVPEPPPDATP